MFCLGWDLLVYPPKAPRNIEPFRGRCFPVLFGLGSWAGFRCAFSVVKIQSNCFRPRPGFFCPPFMGVSVGVCFSVCGFIILHYIDFFKMEYCTNLWIYFCVFYICYAIYIYILIPGRHRGHGGQLCRGRSWCRLSFPRIGPRSHGPRGRCGRPGPLWASWATFPPIRTAAGPRPRPQGTPGAVCQVVPGRFRGVSGRFRGVSGQIPPFFPRVCVLTNFPDFPGHTYAALKFPGTTYAS